MKRKRKKLSRRESRELTLREEHKAYLHDPKCALTSASLSEYRNFLKEQNNK